MYVRSYFLTRHPKRTRGIHTHLYRGEGGQNCEDFLSANVSGSRLVWVDIGLTIAILFKTTLLP